MKKKAIICDLDGTLALFEGNPYDRDFSTDKVNQVVKDILNAFRPLYKIIILSGRKGEHKSQTLDWLDTHGIKYTEFIMREKEDRRKDSVVKREIYDNVIEPFYEVAFVLDDRNQVVDMWRKDLGLTCLQVNYGDF